MQQVHVRNIFQLFIPLSGQTNTGYAITLGGSPSQGLTLTQGSTNYSYHYQIKLLSCDESVESVREESMVWAKRNPYHLQTRDQYIEGIVVRIKINTGVFDFRRGKQRNIRFVVDCFNSETFVGRGASALCQLLPKRRNVDESSLAEDETLVPISWSSNNYSNSYEKSSPEETSPLAYNTSPDDDDSMMQGYSPSDLDASYETSNSNSLVPVNEFPSNEQYMVLYNGNAEVIGNFRALNFYKASDINLKEDIRLLQEDYNCRDVLMQIDGVEYKFKSDVKNSMNKRFVGYIAQQVEKVVPEAVQLIDGILHVDYESLIPYLSESIRENYEDLKQIRKVVDVLYGEFLKNEQLKAQKRNSYGTTTSTPTPTPNLANLTPSGNFVFVHRKSKPWRWTLGVVIGLTLLMSAALATFLIWNSEPIVRVSPLIPATITPHEKFNTTTDKLALEYIYKTMNGPHWRTGYNYNWMSKFSICTWQGIKCDSDSRVTELKMEDANLTGRIPEALANLTHLKKLNFHSNSIHGTLPEFLFEMQNLEVLVLTRCNLTGTLPRAIATSKNLSVVSLGYNYLTGTVPTIGPKSRIKSLELSANNFTGTFPLIHTDLSDLFISNNNFYGEFKLSTESLPTVQKLDFSNNNFTLLRESFFNLTSLRSCNASRNKFKCPIPIWTYKKCNADCLEADLVD